MAASTPFVRSYLRKAWADAQAASVTLQTKLLALNSAAVAAVSGGKVLSATSGNGRSVEFTVQSSEGVSPTAVVEVCDRLLSLYDAAVAAGQTTDAARVAWMLQNLVPIRRVASSFSSMRRGTWIPQPTP